jgi:hypothetical protein
LSTGESKPRAARGVFGANKVLQGLVVVAQTMIPSIAGVPELGLGIISNLNPDLRI